MDLFPYEQRMSDISGLLLACRVFLRREKHCHGEILVVPDWVLEGWHGNNGRLKSLKCNHHRIQLQDCSTFFNAPNGDDTTWGPGSILCWGETSIVLADPLYRWVVYFMENPNQRMDGAWGYPHDETETSGMGQVTGGTPFLFTSK